MASFVVQNTRILKRTHKNPCTFTRKVSRMYRGKDRQTLPLFSELFPFGGKLDPENRWLKIAKLIPWEGIESKYKKYFSEIGRPSSDCRLVIGILLPKHITDFSDDNSITLIKKASKYRTLESCGT